MHKPLRIGITGGIGSGKSLVCKIFSMLGVPVYDADARAKKLMSTDAGLKDRIKEQFGPSSYHADGSLDREFLSRQVFNDPAKLEQLNRLVHPRVAADTERWILEHRKESYVLKEAALLFESGANALLDQIIVVAAGENLRVKRVIRRDPSKTQDEVMKIIQNQIPEDEKIRRADFIIRNDETELVVPQILKLHERFIAFAAH